MRFGITLGMKCCLVLFAQEAVMEGSFHCVRAFWRWLLLPELSNDATIVIEI